MHKRDKQKFKYQVYLYRLFDGNQKKMGQADNNDYASTTRKQEIKSITTRLCLLIN